MEFGPGLPYTLFIWQDTKKIIIILDIFITLIFLYDSDTCLLSLHISLPEVKCANQSSISVSLANCNLITFERINLGV